MCERPAHGVHHGRLSRRSQDPCCPRQPLCSLPTQWSSAIPIHSIWTWWTPSSCLPLLFADGTPFALAAAVQPRAACCDSRGLQALCSALEPWLQGHCAPTGQSLWRVHQPLPRTSPPTHGADWSFPHLPAGPTEGPSCPTRRRWVLSAPARGPSLGPVPSPERMVCYRNSRTSESYSLRPHKAWFSRHLPRERCQETGLSGSKLLLESLSLVF